MIVSSGDPGVNTSATPWAFERVDIGPRDDAAREHQRIEPAGAELVDHLRDERHVRTREQREPHGVGVLLERRFRDLAGSLEQTCVDDLEAGVAQRPGDHLRAAIVTVQPGLGNDDAVASQHSPPPVAGAVSTRRGDHVSHGLGAPAKGLSRCRWTPSARATSR